jgi:hypothetical protein
LGGGRNAPTGARRSSHTARYVPSTRDVPRAYLGTRWVGLPYPSAYATRPSGDTRARATSAEARTRASRASRDQPMKTAAATSNHAPSAHAVAAVEVDRRGAHARRRTLDYREQHTGGGDARQCEDRAGLRRIRPHGNKRASDRQTEPPGEGGAAEHPTKGPVVSASMRKAHQGRRPRTRSRGRPPGKTNQTNGGQTVPELTSALFAAHDAELASVVRRLGGPLAT